MKLNKLAFIDLETTGLDPEKHEIIEIGCILVEPIYIDGKLSDLKKLEEIEIKVRPTNISTADPEALRINRYSEIDWLFAVDLPKAIELLAQKTDGAVMVAHNISFDWSFLSKAFSQTGVVNKMSYHRLDLLSIAFAKLHRDDRLQKYNLWSLAEYFGINNEKAHTALADVQTTLEIYKRLMSL